MPPCGSPDGFPTMARDATPRPVEHPAACHVAASPSAVSPMVTTRAAPLRNESSARAPAAPLSSSVTDHAPQPPLQSPIQPPGSRGSASTHHWHCVFHTPNQRRTCRDARSCSPDIGASPRTGLSLQGRLTLEINLRARQPTPTVSSEQEPGQQKPTHGQRQFPPFWTPLSSCALPPGESHRPRETPLAGPSFQKTGQVSKSLPTATTTDRLYKYSPRRSQRRVQGNKRIFPPGTAWSTASLCHVTNAPARKFHILALRS